jgi:hypothetical protein
MSPHFAAQRARNRRAVLVGVTSALAGAVLLVASAGGGVARLVSAYAAAYFAALGVALGALIWVQIAHVSRALWLVPLRRQLENVAALLPLLAVMMLPLLVLRHGLYPWAEHGRSKALAAVVDGAPSAWLHASVGFAVWIVTAELLRRWSRANDVAPSDALVSRQRTLAAAAIPPFGLTLTMFAFDFLMTLDEGFRSTIYGLYMFAGAAVSGLAIAAVLGALARHARALPPGLGAPPFFALGKMLFAMVLFWAYIAFCQLVLVWLANLPVEVGWYLARTRGPWAALAVVVAFACFVVPFVLLLSRRFKTSATRLGFLGAALLLAQYLDVAWRVLPPLRPDGPFPTFVDAGAVLLVAGLAVAFGALRAAGSEPIAVADPELERSLAFEDA